MISLHFDGTARGEYILDQPVRLVAHAGGGNDLMIGSPKGDQLFGGGGMDLLEGWEGNDEIHGGAGADVIAAGSGGDRVFGDGGRDFINGEAGRDKIDGGAGADILWGGNDADHIQGGRGNDVLFGASPAVYPPASFKAFEIDWNGLTGQQEPVLAWSNLGSLAPLDTSPDVLGGGWGSDQLDGGFGNDWLTGGAGADRFLFTTTPGVFNVDRITDFKPGVDRIGLAGLVFTTLGAEVDPGEFRPGGTAKDLNDHILYKQSTGELLYDPDGKGGLAPQTFAVLTNHAHLTSHDFLVV